MPKSPWWGRKVARLPERGTLIVATDLQGNYGDYEALKRLYAREAEAGNEPVLLLCGDLVHGPGPLFADPSRWPDYLGTYYRDRSVDLVLDYAEWIEQAQTVALLGNHEHAHIGGPVVSKFHADEAAVLDDALGDRIEQAHALFRTFPLIAVAACGAVFTHGAPRATEPSLEAFERLRYDGYEDMGVNDMYEQGTLGALLWARGAEPEHARDLGGVIGLCVAARGRAGVEGHHQGVLGGGDALLGLEEVAQGHGHEAQASIVVGQRARLDGPQRVGQSIEPGCIDARHGRRGQRLAAERGGQHRVELGGEGHVGHRSQQQLDLLGIAWRGRAGTERRYHVGCSGSSSLGSSSG